MTMTNFDHFRRPSGGYSLHLFYGGPFSQWADSPMLIDGIEYTTAEHYMMAQKARLFMDAKALKGVMDTDNPAEAKAWGRKVQNFNAAKWAVVARDVVRTASFAKFCGGCLSERDRAYYYDALFQTRGQLLVEASPTDQIWGIGLGEDDPRASNPANWRGMNWLGQVITEVRMLKFGH